MTRSVLTRRIAILSILILCFAGSVAALNVTLYSATGFVGSYLNALARHDVEGALEMRGVEVPDGASRALLAPGALAELSDIHLVSDVDAGAGQHDVTYGYTVGGATARTTFSVTHTGPRLAVFSGWRFTRTPISVLQVTPLHARDFTANGVALVSAEGANKPVPLAVLTPARVSLTHQTDYFSARAAAPVVDTIDAQIVATVDVQANRTFVAQVQKELNANLAECVTQKVLLPTGCPMGTQIADRIQDAPTWKMVEYPAITIVPGEREGEWVVPNTEGIAHLTVSVRSIFDGTVSTVSKDVSFTVKYALSFPNGQLTIVAQY